MSQIFLTFVTEIIIKGIRLWQTLDKNSSQLTALLTQ